MTTEKMVTANSHSINNDNIFSDNDINISDNEIIEDSVINKPKNHKRQALTSIGNIGANMLHTQNLMNISSNSHSSDAEEVSPSIKQEGLNTGFDIDIDFLDDEVSSVPCMFESIDISDEEVDLSKDESIDISMDDDLKSNYKQQSVIKPIDIDIKDESSFNEQNFDIINDFDIINNFDDIDLDIVTNDDTSKAKLTRDVPSQPVKEESDDFFDNNIDPENIDPENIDLDDIDLDDIDLDDISFITDADMLAPNEQNINDLSHSINNKNKSYNSSKSIKKQIKKQRKKQIKKLSLLDRLTTGILSAMLFGFFGMLIDFVVSIFRAISGVGTGDIIWLFAPFLLILGSIIGVMHSSEDKVTHVNTHDKSLHNDDGSLLKLVLTTVIVCACIWLIFIMMI